MRVLQGQQPVPDFDEIHHELDEPKCAYDKQYQEEHLRLVGKDFREAMTTMT